MKHTAYKIVTRSPAVPHDPWGVHPLATGPEVAFTEEQAKAVADTLNRLERRFPEHLSEVEADIIDALLTKVFEDYPRMCVAGYLEDEPLFDLTQDREVIEREIAAGDHTLLVFNENVGGVFEAGPIWKKLGWVLLVHGNEEDVITDYSASPAMDDLIEAVTPEH